MSDTTPSTNATTRRNFVKGTAALGVGAALASTGIASRAYAQQADTIKVGLIGCGGRGTGAAQDAVGGSNGVKITALADLFPDRLEGSANTLKNNLNDKFDVPANQMFSGWDAYKQVIATDVDMVILATPPHFRPMMLKAAVDAGKHVFFEKPVAVDSWGCRLVEECGKIAEQKGLGIVTGTQRRHEVKYIEAMKRVHDGMIGDVIGAYVYWQQGSLWNKGREQGWSDMEWQLRNWLYFTWLSGDHIVEQHVHNIDVALWAFQDQAPIKAYGNGGRQQRTGPEWGHINDHFSLEVMMPGAKRFTSFSRQIPGCDNYVAEEIYGSKGILRTGDRNRLYSYDGKLLAELNNPGGHNPYVQEHTDLIASIRAGEPLNEAARIAQSTRTAIMCREAAYSGKNCGYDFLKNDSKLQLKPDSYAFGPIETPPVYIPGEYQLS